MKSPTVPTIVVASVICLTLGAVGGYYVRHFAEPKEKAGSGTPPPGATAGMGGMMGGAPGGGPPGGGSGGPPGGGGMDSVTPPGPLSPPAVEPPAAAAAVAAADDFGLSDLDGLMENLTSMRGELDSVVRVFALRF